MISGAVAALVLPAAVGAAMAKRPAQTETAALIAATDRDFAALDANRDGKATRAEVKARIVRQHPQIDAASLNALADQMMLRMDSDHNGAITRAEALRMVLQAQAKKR